MVKGIQRALSKLDLTSKNYIFGLVKGSISTDTTLIGSGTTVSPLSVVQNYVKLTNDETIADVKTFSSSPIVPTPTTDYQTATKKYVDDNIIKYLGTCSTSAATSAKTVAITGFALTTGIKVLVTFTNANTADTPTLNIESTGAKAIYTRDNVAISATNLFRNKAGETCEFYYNGTYWVVDTTKIKNANYAMPSNTYITAFSKTSLSTTVVSFTSPANGCFIGSIYSYSPCSFIIGVNGYDALNAGLNYATFHLHPLIIPLKKGDVLTIRTDSNTGIILKNNFYYAQGEV